ncbi:hypothetical protein ACFP3U_35900 [Kitasatospora misakiensis]|uniref:Uncharacterized protein n=1 Tax=Kitasatospora misakiensis TaxID=67330 RepID=A0ABW0XF02_9ACTN
MHLVDFSISAEPKTVGLIRRTVVPLLVATLTLTAGTRTSWFEMEVAALAPDQTGEETAAVVSSSDPVPQRPWVNRAALAARIWHARPAPGVGVIGLTGPTPVAA